MTEIPGKLTWRVNRALNHPKAAEKRGFVELEGWDLVDSPIAGRIYAMIRPRRGIGGWSFYGTNFSGARAELDEAKAEAEAKVRSLKPHPMNRRPEED